ncbi:MAG TPA: hypothetical protein VGF28_25720 [Thermoanaerobaculia bacterium]|jgi:hypothetical protein
MRIFTPFAVFVLAFAAGAAEIPDVIADEDGPLWVAADVAVTPEGQLRTGAFGRFGESVERDARVAAERERASSSSDECQTYFGNAVCTHFEPTSTIDDLTSRAGEIVAGVIVAVRQGFWGGSPGSLLLLDATYLKGSKPRETYLFYPYARIVTADAALCAKPLGPFVPPRPGDRLLIFSMGKPIPPRDDRHVFQVRTDRELVHEPRGGDLLVPDSLLPYAGELRQFDAVLDAVVQRLGLFGCGTPTPSHE